MRERGTLEAVPRSEELIPFAKDPRNAGMRGGASELDALPLLVLDPPNWANGKDEVEAGRDVLGAGPDHGIALECQENRYLRAMLLELR